MVFWGEDPTRGFLEGEDGEVRRRGEIWSFGNGEGIRGRLLAFSGLELGETVSQIWYCCRWGRFSS